MSEGFLKFCELMLNVTLGQIILSQILQTYKLAALTTFDFMRPEKQQQQQTSNTIITMA